MPLEPFKYNCTACGKCCKWGGYVCLYIEDIKRIAKYLKLTVQEFADKYTKHITVEYVSPEGTVVVPYLALITKNDTCVLLDGKLCSVHSVKPIHCESSPLLAEFLLEDSGWKMLVDACEGIGKGSVITRPEIDLALQQQAERDVKYEKQLSENNWQLEKVLNIKLEEPELIPDMGFEVEIDY